MRTLVVKKIKELWRQDVCEGLDSLASDTGSDYTEKGNTITIDYAEQGSEPWIFEKGKVTDSFKEFLQNLSDENLFNLLISFVKSEE